MTTIEALPTERGRILKTTDYTLFRCNEHNKFDKKHLESLISEMSEKNLSKDLPIIVDKDYNILDGKYRFHANRKLGQPIYYKIAEVGVLVDFLVAKDLHLTMSTKDYAIFHYGNINYRRLIDWCNKLPFRFDGLVYTVTGVNKRQRLSYTEFKRGTFEYKKEFDFKFSFIEYVVEYFYTNVTKEYILNLNDVTAIHDNYLKSEVEETFQDKSGYIKKWVKIIESGHPLSSTFQLGELLNQIYTKEFIEVQYHTYETVGMLELIDKVFKEIPINNVVETDEIKVSKFDENG